MEAQEIFDKVTRHLERQGRRATIGGTCAYRGVMGTKCAIGVLIEDREYSCEMEGKAAVELWDEGLLPGRYGPHIDLLDYLQHIHDVEDPNDWSGQLQQAAQCFNLTYNGKFH